jgi:hypothetical protein
MELSKQWNPASKPLVDRGDRRREWFAGDERMGCIDQHPLILLRIEERSKPAQTFGHGDHPVSRRVGIGRDQMNRAETDQRFRRFSGAAAERPGEAPNGDLEGDATLRELHASFRVFLDVGIAFRVGEDGLISGRLEGKERVVHKAWKVHARNIDQDTAGIHHCCRLSGNESICQFGGETNLESREEPKTELSRNRKHLSIGVVHASPICRVQWTRQMGRGDDGLESYCACGMQHLAGHVKGGSAVVNIRQDMAMEIDHV